MAERKNLDRKDRSKGSQPVVFESATQDALAGMVGRSGGVEGSVGRQ